MSWVAPKLVGRIPVAALANPPAIVELFADTIVEELDFRLEAENMLDIGRVLAETGQRSIVVPRPHPSLITRRVLVMERLHGYNFDDVESIKAGVLARLFADIHVRRYRGIHHFVPPEMIYTAAYAQALLSHWRAAETSAAQLPL